MSSDALFETLSLQDLERLTSEQLDELPFGVTALAASGEVVRYNESEARQGGLSKDTVVGQHYFVEIAPCMNNFMVAQRFEDEPHLDVTMDYVLTFRMRPKPVRLRLLKSPEVGLRYLLIKVEKRS